MDDPDTLNLRSLNLFIPRYSGENRIRFSQRGDDHGPFSGRQPLFMPTAISFAESTTLRKQ